MAVAAAHGRGDGGDGDDESVSAGNLFDEMSKRARGCGPVDVYLVNSFYTLKFGLIAYITVINVLV